MTAKYFLIPLLLISLGVCAQQKNGGRDKEDFYIIENDSLTIPLDEIVVLDKRNFDSDKERRYYYWYYKKVQKAYPYSTIASEKLTEINQDLSSIKSNRKKKKHVKRMQKYMEGEFTDELKKMTKTEGRILIKLIHRQTGMTMYDLIKEYRSGWKAFWYNSTAQVFRLNLKTEYRPDEEALDFIVEDILQRAFVRGTLERQNSALELDYYELSKKWKSVSVEQELTAYIDKYLK